MVMNFKLGETPEDPMELISGEVGVPKIHLYNGDEGNMCPWVSKNTSLGNVLVPTGAIPNQPNVPTPDYSGYIHPRIPEMPQAVLNEALAFFRFVLEIGKTEAALLIAMDEDNKYHLHCPEQEVEYSGVEWKDDVQLPEDQYLMGSIHSHCDFSAFHSGTDTGDAAKNDGLHITLGHIDRDVPEIDVMLSFSGIRWEKWDTDFIEGDRWIPPTADDGDQVDLFDPEWLDKLKEPTRWTSYGNKGGKKFAPKKQASGVNPGYLHGGGFGWDDEDWDDWGDYGEWGMYGSEVAWHSRPDKGKWEKSEDDRDGIGNYRRINPDSNWYDDNHEVAQDQIIKDMQDLTLLAQEVGMTINFSVQYRDGADNDQPFTSDNTPLLPELAAAKEEEVENDLA